MFLRESLWCRLHNLAPGCLARRCLVHSLRLGLLDSLGYGLLNGPANGLGWISGSHGCEEGLVGAIVVVHGLRGVLVRVCS